MISKKQTFIIAALIILALAGFWIMPYLNRQQPRKITNIANVDRQYADIKFNDLRKLNLQDDIYKFNFSLKNVPTESKVYDYQKATLANQEIEDINKKLNLKITNSVDNTPVGKFIVANKPNTTISYYPDAGWYIFVTSDGLSGDINSMRFSANDNIEEYKIEALNKFNKDFGSLDGYEYKGYTLRQYPSPHYDVVNSKNLAGLIEFTYEEKINNLVVYDYSNAPLHNSVSIFIAKDKSIKRVEVKKAGKILSESQKFSLKTYKELVDSIKSGQAVIVESELQPQDKIVEAIIKDAKVSYIIKDGKLIPIYVLKGVLQSSSGYTSDAVWYVNAIS